MGTLWGVHLFGFAAGFENKIQAAGGNLVADGWTVLNQLFSARQKMQTNPCCSSGVEYRKLTRKTKRKQL